MRQNRVLMVLGICLVMEPGKEISQAKEQGHDMWVRMRPLDDSSSAGRPCDPVLEAISRARSHSQIFKSSFPAEILHICSW